MKRIAMGILTAVSIVGAGSMFLAATSSPFDIIIFTSFFLVPVASLGFCLYSVLVTDGFEYWCDVSPRVRAAAYIGWLLGIGWPISWCIILFDYH